MVQCSRSQISVAEQERQTNRVEKTQVVSELDLEIKRELVVQALLLAKPAPQNKTSRLRKQWEPRNVDVCPRDIVPLNDEGRWQLPGNAKRAEAVRPDEPSRCPALEALEFHRLVAPRVWEYMEAHLALFRCWSKGCGQGREQLGQAQVLRLLERGGLVGAGCIFSDRVSAQLWLSRMWRDIAGGTFGLSLPQYVILVGKIGQMLAGDTDGEGSVSPIAGVLECVSRGVFSD